MEFEDTPLFDWLKKNRLFLLVLLVGILALAANERFGPAIRDGAIAKSWDLFQTVTADLNIDENLSSSLQLAREDDRIFPWIVFGATKAALLQRNMNALQTLRPELEGLSSGSGSNLAMASPSGSISIASFLLERVTEMEAGESKTFVNPEPAGTSVKFVVTDSLETTYEFTVGTYEASAPGASELFLSAVEAGTFVAMPLTGFGGRTLKLEGLGAEASPPLERDFGFFHLAGSLSTIQKPGEPGEQEVDSIQILLEDNTFADGQATVFGSITAGLDELKTAIISADPEITFTVTSATVL
jgi:hypothetical protein